MYKPSPKRYVNPNIGLTNYHIPIKKVNEEEVKELFTIINDADFEKIQNFLSRSSINYNVRDEQDQSLLHYVINSENQAINADNKLKLLRYLVENGTSVNSFDKNNITPLHLAAKFQLYEIVKFLLKNGADAKALDSQNRNAMHYAILSRIKECKKRRRVGSLIPKSNIKSNFAFEFKNIALQILDIFDTRHFNKFFRHIKESIRDSENIFPEFFKKLKEDSLNSISTELANPNLTLTEKNALIENKLSGSISSQYNGIRGFFEKSLKRMDIRPSQKNGWGPTGNERDKILPNLDTQTTISDYTKNFNSRFSQIFNEDLGKLLSSIREVSDKLLKNRNEIASNLNRILFLNLFLEMNSFGEDPDNIRIPWERIGRLYSFPYKEEDRMEFDELNIHGIINTFVIEPIGNPDDIRIARATTDEIIRSRQNRTPLIEIELTLDRLPALNADLQTEAGRKNMLGRKINLADLLAVGPIFDKHGRILNPYEGFYNGRVFYFTSILDLVIERINDHRTFINGNFAVAFNHYQKGYLFEIYNILIQIYLSMFNIFEICFFGNDHKVIISSQVEELISVWNQILTTKNHPYSFAIDHATQLATSIRESITNIYKLMDELYENLNQLVPQMNNMIDFVNRWSGGIYLQKYYLDDTGGLLDFKETLTGNTTEMFNQNLPLFPLLPSTLKSYFNEYSNDPNKIEVRKMIYEDFIPTVNVNSFPRYYSKFGNNQNLTTDYNLRSVLLSYRVDDQPNALSQTIAPNDRNPRIGYLVDIYLWDVNNDVPIDIKNYPRIPAGNQNMDEQGNVINNLDPSNAINTGILGFHKGDLRFNRNRSAIPSIGNNLDLHLSIIKYQLIQNVINLFFNKYSAGIPSRDNTPLLLDNDILTRMDVITKQFNNFLINEGYQPVNASLILALTVGTLADEFIINFIEYHLRQKITNYLASITKNLHNTEDIDQIISKINMNENINILFNDLGFELNLNSIFDEIVEKFRETQMVPMDPRYDQLKYSAMIMEEEVSPREQFPILNNGYFSQVESKDRLCYNSDSRIIDLLCRCGTRTNQQDSILFTPIFYAINQLNPKIIKKLLLSGADICSIKNKNGETAWKYFLKIYQSHNNTLNGNNTNGIADYLNNICRFNFDKISKNLVSKEEYKNNIIKYFGNFCPQIIVMYNNFFYLHLISYINNWNFSDSYKLKRILEKYGLPVRNNPNYLPFLDFKKYLLGQDSNLNVLTTEKKLLAKDIFKNQTLISQKRHQVENIQQEINDLRLLANNNNNIQQTIAYHQERIDNLNQEINFLSKLMSDETNSNQIIGNNLENKIEVNWSELKKRRNNFVGHSKQLSMRNSFRLYENIFNYVINNNDLSLNVVPIKGKEDFYLYNELWNAYLKNNLLLSDISNIHLIVTVVQNRIIDAINEGILPQSEILEDLAVLNKLYKSIFEPLIKDYEELPYEYNNNYVLNEIFVIYTHVTAHIVFSSLYFAIIKTITKYILTLNPHEFENILPNPPNKSNNSKFQSDEDYNKFIVEIVNRVLDLNYNQYPPNPRLEKYIVYEMPLLVTKLLLGIYADENDKMIFEKINNMDQIFEKIINIIMENKVISISKNSSLIDSLKNNIFPYYKDILDQLLSNKDNMMNIISSYNNFIRNQGRFLEILQLFLTQNVVNQNSCQLPF